MIKYYFRPHLHWNQISKEVYVILLKHYNEDRLIWKGN